MFGGLCRQLCTYVLYAIRRGKCNELLASMKSTRTCLRALMRKRTLRDKKTRRSCSTRHPIKVSTGIVHHARGCAVQCNCNAWHTPHRNRLRSPKSSRHLRLHLPSPSSTAIFAFMNVSMHRSPRSRMYSAVLQCMRTPHPKSSPSPSSFSILPSSIFASSLLH